MVKKSKICLSSPVSAPSYVIMFLNMIRDPHQLREERQREDDSSEIIQQTSSKPDQKSWVTRLMVLWCCWSLPLQKAHLPVDLRCPGFIFVCKEHLDTLSWKETAKWTVGCGCESAGKTLIESKFTTCLQQAGLFLILFSSGLWFLLILTTYGSLPLPSSPCYERIHLTKWHPRCLRRSSGLLQPTERNRHF